jgi:hypothetical protein
MVINPFLRTLRSRLAELLARRSIHEYHILLRAYFDDIALVIRHLRSTFLIVVFEFNAFKLVSGLGLNKYHQVQLFALMGQFLMQRSPPA